MYGVRQLSMPGFRAILLLIAGLDLVLRYGDVLSGLVLASISLGIGAGVLNLTQWLVFVAALALIADKLYPPPMRDLAKTVPIRLITAATGTGIAMVLTAIDGLDDASLFIAVIVTFSVASALVFRLFGVSVFDEESPLVLGLDWFAQGEGIAHQELDDARNYEGWRRLFALGVFAVAVHVVIIAPILVAGILTMMLVETFPLPDLLVVTYVLGTAAATRVEHLSPPPAALQVDDYLLTFARHATNGIHGIFVVLLFGVGIFMTVTTPILVIRPVTDLLLTAVRPPILPVLTWNVIGLWTLYLASALYGFWFWLRTTPRIVAFLERWDDEPHKTPFKSRPRSLLLPSLIATGVATVGLEHGFLGANRHAFAVAWPLTAVSVVWVVRRTRRRHPSVTRREDLAVVASTLIAYLTLMMSLSIVSNDPSVLMSPDVGLFCGMVLYVAGIGRVKRYAHQHNRRYGSETDDERRLALSVYFCVGGLVALLITGYLDDTIRVLVLVGGVALVVLGVALGITSYYRL